MAQVQVPVQVPVPALELVLVLMLEPMSLLKQKAADWPMRVLQALVLEPVASPRMVQLESVQVLQTKVLERATESMMVRPVREPVAWPMMMVQLATVQV